MVSSTPRPCTAIEGSRLYPVRVLIIDDHQGTRETFSLLLRVHGFQAVTAENGRAGIAFAIAAPFDVILVDLHLPDMRGTDVVRELKEHGVSAPIVVVTAFPELESSFDAGCASAAGFVDGPLFGDEVARVVRQALHGPFPVRHPSRLRGDERNDRGEPSSSSRAAAPLDPRIRKVIQLIEAEPGTASPETLSETVDLSESGLRGLFADHVGTPISRFIADRRLELTARELIDTLDPIGSIADRIGVGDRRHFRKAFRSRFGMSAQAYRARFWRPLGAP